jgi:hypothetical protein
MKNTALLSIVMYQRSAFADLTNTLAHRQQFLGGSAKITRYNAESVKMKTKEITI